MRASKFRSGVGFFLTLASGLLFSPQPRLADAATYTWLSATLGGLWSSSANWDPSTGTPIAGDIAVLDTVSGTTIRTITYNTAATGAFSTLTLNQTSSGTNVLDVQRNLTVSNTITLGASNGGFVKLMVSPNSGTTATSSTLTASAVINAGGILSLLSYNLSGTSSVGNGNISGSVLLQGGQLLAESSRNGTAGGSTTSIGGTLTMTSGTLLLQNPSNYGDRRLQVNGLNVTGGDVLTTATNATLATFVLNNTTTNTFNPTNFSSAAIQLSMQGGSGTQSLATNQIVNVLARGNGVKVLTPSITGTNFGSLVLVDGNVDAASTIFRLNSNLTLASGRNLPRSDAPTPQAAQRFDLGIDLNAYTMDLTANSGTFTPNTSYGSGTATTYWTFTGSGGRIVANGFNLTGTAGVATSVGPGVILESRSGNGGANSLSLGSGTGTLSIDPTSLFRYSGTAAAATPATLVSTRSIGDVEVTSGALNVTSLAGMGAMRVTGGVLIASSSSSLPNPATAITVASGATVTLGNAFDDAAFVALSSGTGVAAGASIGFDTSAGGRTYGGSINASLGFAKTGANTLTLTAANSYSGPTSILAGTLSVADAGALGTSGSIRFGGGTLQYTAGNTVDYSSRILGSSAAITIDTNGQSVTWASSLDPSNIGGLTKSGAGLLTLSGTSTSLPSQVTLNGGTTVIDPGLGGSFSTSGRFYVGSASGASTATLASGSVFVSPTGNSAYISLADNASGTATLNVTGGAVALTSTNASGRVMVGNKGVGVFNVSGGMVTIAGGNAIHVGGDSQWAQSNANGTFTISGGTVAITGAGSFVLGNSGTVGNANTGVVGTLNLNGGELQTIRTITRGTSGTAANAQAGYVSLNGGVLKPLASSTSFMTGLTAAYVENGGAIIDTNGFDVTIGQALLSGTGGSTGGLTKNGAGTLTLTGASTYTGATTVAGGTLALSGGSNRLGPSSSLLFTGGTVAMNGGSQTVSSLAVADSTAAALVSIGSSSPTLTVTNAITLGGGSGTSTLLVQPTTAYNTALAASNGITLNAGSDLRLGAVITGSNAFNGGVVNAPVTINNGGSLTLGAMTGTAGGFVNTGGVAVNAVGFLTMNGGRLFIDNSGTNADRRFSLNGNVAITGGTIAQATGTFNGNGLTLSGSSTGISNSTTGNYSFTISPASYDSYIGVAMFATGTTALTLGMASDQVPYQIMYRNWGRQVLSSTAAGNPIANIFIQDSSSTPGVGNTVQLGSNLTLVPTGNAPQTSPAFSTSPEAGGRADMGIDADGYTFDMTNMSSRWTPNSSSVSGTPVQAYWQLSSSSGTGRFIANGFNFVFGTGSAGVANAYTGVGPNVVLESRAGNNIANNLGSSGTSGLVIDPSSTFRYSGTAAAATPSTLTAARAIGDLEVAGSGALRILSLAGGAQNLRVSSGILDGGSNSLSFAGSATITGGAVQSGTITAAGGYALQAGSVSAALAGSGVALTKTTSGTATLSGANTYTGLTTLSDGTLVVNGSLVSAVTIGGSGILAGSGSVGALDGAGLVGPGNSPGILTAPSVDPSGGLDFAFEFTQVAPNYANATASDNDLLWLTDTVTPFTGSLTNANTVNIYLTQSAAALSELTGGFFTAAAGDFFASISGATFQYFVQDAAGTFSYNGQAYKTLAQYDPSKSISVTTVGANSGQVMQLVVVPEPGAIVLAGVGAAIAAWACRRGKMPL